MKLIRTLGLHHGCRARQTWGELSSMGIQEFMNKKLVCVEAIDAPA